MQFTISDTDKFPEIGFVRLTQILAVIPICKSSWWAGVKSGRYPKSVKLSARCTVWKAEDIRSLIKELSEQVQKQATESYRKSE
jgi:prophage regulatory protein